VRSGAHLAVDTLASVDPGVADRTVARLHQEEPTFDRVGVYVLGVDSNPPDAFGDRMVSVIEDAARRIAAGAPAR
jgi:hypothetical protein